MSREQPSSTPKSFPASSARARFKFSAAKSFIYRFAVQFRCKPFIYRFYALRPGCGGPTRLSIFAPCVSRFGQLSSFLRLAHSLSPSFTCRPLFSKAYTLFLQKQGVAPLPFSFPLSRLKLPASTCTPDFPSDSDLIYIYIYIYVLILYVCPHRRTTHGRLLATACGGTPPNLSFPAS
jgi:hypothetical protein